MVFALIIVSASTLGFSQINLSGKVTNSKNEALSNVSVKIKDVSIGTYTDIEGRYILKLTSNKKYELEFSTIGYQKIGRAHV